MQTAGRNYDLFRFRRPLPQDRFVNVIAVFLFLEHRDVFLRDHVERNIFDRDPVELRINRDQVERARLVRVNVTKIALGLVPDHVRQCRDQGVDVASHAATAFTFEAFGDETHRVGRIRESFELQLKLRVSVIVGFLFAEIDCLLGPSFLFVDEWIEKGEVLKFGKRKFRRRELDLAGYAPVGCRRAVKISQRDRGAHVVWVNPAARRPFGKTRFNLHPVGQEFFDARGCRSKQRAALIVLNEIDVDCVNAGRRFVRGLVVQFDKAAFRECYLFGLHLQVAGIDDFGFDRQAFEIAAPVALFDHETDVNFVAGPIDAALGEDKGIEPFGSDILRPVGFETREIQHAVFSCERHERDVVAIAGHKRDRRFLALRFFNGRESAVPVRGSVRCLDRNAILAQNFNRRAADWFAGLDRHQKHVAAAIGILLCQNSDVGHEQEPAVLD